MYVVATYSFEFVLALNRFRPISVGSKCFTTEHISYIYIFTHNLNSQQFIGFQFIETLTFSSFEGWIYKAEDGRFPYDFSNNFYITFPYIKY